MKQFYQFFKTPLTTITLVVLLVSSVHDGLAQTTLFSETFESASNATVTTSPGYNNWTLYINTSGASYWSIMNSSSCRITGNYSLAVRSEYSYCDYGNDGTYYYAADKIAYNTFSSTGYSGMTLSFKWKCYGEANYHYGKVCYSTNGTTWTNLSTQYYGHTTTQTASVTLPSSLDNKATVYIGFRWTNDASYVYAPGFVVDDITVTGSAICSGTPAAPVPSAATNIATSSFTANWAASSGANAYYLDVSTVSNFASFVTGYNNKSVGNVTSASVTGLSANTTYYYRVRAKCTGTSSSSTTTTVTTSPNYCTPTVTNDNYRVIDNFSTTGGTTNITNNGTGWTGVAYNYYSAMNLTISAGATFNLTVGGMGVNPVGFRIWIDYNNDGDFADAGESVFTAGVGTGTGYTGSVTVPSTASIGLTRLRIRSSDVIVSSGSSCGNQTYGEIEDYNITITTPPGASYGIYAPGAISGVSDCEIYAQGGSGTAGCLVCGPTDAGYSNVAISGYPIITATNVSCTNTNITLATSAGSPTWSGSSPLSGSGASRTIQYTTTGRKNVTLNAVNCPAAASTTASPGTSIADYACNSNTGTSSTITVSGYTGCTINTANITVKVNVTHTNDADVMLYLIAPNGATLCLSTGNGSTGDNYTNTIFSDAGATNITSGSAPFTGTYRPEGSMGASSCKAPTVATFTAIAGAGYNPNGNWTLFASDQTSNGVGGTLVSWTLNLPAASGSASNYTYTGFTNMMMAPPSSGSVSGTANGCPGTYAYASSKAGTPGFTYAWSISPSAGVTIATPTASSTNITFPSTSTTYTVTCTPSSECCGTLTAVTYTTTISAPPAAPTASAANGTPCVGGTTTLTATAPANSTFYWYSASSGGTSLGSGSSFTTSAATAGANTYYVEAVNTAGCSSTSRTAVVVTGTATPAPTCSGVTRCGAGSVTLDITSPVAGYTYTWYTGSCGGTQVQSNTGVSYTGTVSSTTTIYVTATAPGCSPSACTSVSVTVNAVGASLTWSGSGATGANNWFSAANWGGCIPTCASDVTIPVTVNPPDIGYNAAGGAACKSITLQTGATLSFSDAKGELSICGNVTHNGILTTNSKGILIFNGTTGGQTYTKAVGATGDFNDIILNNTSGTPTLTLSSDLSLGTGGNFTFQSGKVITGSNNLIIKNTESSSVSGHNSSRYVEGNLRRYINTGTPMSYDFPVGTSAKGYQLANVNFTSAPSTITYLTANFNAYASLPSALNLSECMATYNQSALNNGYWDISANNSQNNVGTYNMTLYNTNYSNAYSGFTIMSQHNGSSTWALVNGDGSSGTCVISPVTAVERRNMKGFSKFGVAQSLSVLPIELLSFDAVYNGHSTDVNWATASETNNDHFIIERSTDAQEFNVIAKVPSKAKGGNSTSKLYYELNDPDVKPGVYYYRLKQVDFDGKLTFSSVAMVVVAEHEMLTVIPNPTDNLADVNYESSSMGVALLKVYDTRGRLVNAKELICTKGHNSYTLDLHEEMSGMFYVVLSVGGKVYNTKLLKQ